MREGLMVLTSTGVIQQKLEELRIEIEVKVRNALSLEVTEETYKEIKKVRADLNKDFKEIDAQRIGLKKAYMAPYDEFEALYRANVTDIFKPAEAALKQRIDDVENELKNQKKAEIDEWFKEYCSSVGLEEVDFSKTGIQFNMTVSAKKLKEMARDWADKRVADIEWISGQEDSAEIMIEYDATGNAIQAANIVKARKEQKATYELRIAREKEAQAEKEAAAQKVLEAMKKEELEAPVVVEEEQIYEVTFTVKGTKEKIKSLKEYMMKEGLIDG